MLLEKPGKVPLKQSIEPGVPIDCLKNRVTKEKIKKKAATLFVSMHLVRN